MQGEEEAPFVFRITLVQGLNRQIRRMCEHFGFEVTKLERIRIMNVSLKGLPVGEWRDLTDDELIDLFKLIEDSSSEVKPAKGDKPKAAKAPAAQTAKPAQGKKPRRDDDHEIGGRPNVPGPEAFEKKLPVSKGGAGKGAANKGGAGKGAPKGGKPAAGKPRTANSGRQKKGR